MVNHWCSVFTYSQVEYPGRAMAVGSVTTAERNIITALAVDMVGSTRHIAACDPDEAQAFLDHWLDHIRGSVERAGGQIVHWLRQAQFGRQQLRHDFGTNLSPDEKKALLEYLKTL